MRRARQGRCSQHAWPELQVRVCRAGRGGAGGLHRAAAVLVLAVLWCHGQLGSGCLLGMAARQQQQQQQQQLLCRGDRRAVCPAERAPCRLCAEPVGWLRECEGAQHRPSLCARLPVMVQQLSQARVWLCVAVCHICVPAGSASSAGCCTPSRTLTGSASPAACSWTNTTCAAAAAASRRRPAPRSATTAAQVQAGQWGQRPWTRTAV